MRILEDNKWKDDEVSNFSMKLLVSSLSKRFYLSLLFVYRAINKLELIHGESIRAKTNTKVYEKLLFIKSSCRSILVSFHSR